MPFELGDLRDRFFSEFRRFGGDLTLAGSLWPGCAAIERGNELAEAGNGPHALTLLVGPDPGCAVQYRPVCAALTGLGE